MSQALQIQKIEQSMPSGSLHSINRLTHAHTNTYKIYTEGIQEIAVSGAFPIGKELDDVCFTEFSGHLMSLEHH